MSEQRSAIDVLQTASEAAAAEMQRIGAGPWGEDTDFPKEDWRYEIANDETVLGYWDWLHVKRVDAREDESEEQPLVAPNGESIVGRRIRAFAIEYGQCALDGNGNICFRFSGDEEIDWQIGHQETADYDYVDAKGSRWCFEQLKTAGESVGLQDS
jgi:hypothetical protein